MRTTIMRQRTDRRYRQGFAAAILIGVCLVPRSILLAQEGYVGAKVCGTCHPEKYQSQSESNHAKALHPVSTIAELEVPGGGWGESTDINAAHFEFRKSPDAYTVTVALGKEQKEIPIDWVFGAAEQGYTFFSRLSKGQFLEHRLSYYKRKPGFDITPGQRAYTSLLEDAIGMRVYPADAFRCLRCHSTYVKQTPDGPDFSSVVPGVTCERCHGPGAAHVNAIRSGASERRILNPGKLSGDELLLMCGECHRAEPPPGMLFDDPIVTRFQPIGLQMSACFQKSNGGAITCTTCHNPHENARRSADGFYNQRCMNCHNRPSARRCTVQPASGCIGCHMPKTVPIPYMRFTDHWIRVRSRT